MIERPRSYIALPLPNADRKRAYWLKLIASPSFDEHEHSRRVSRGLVVLDRLHAYWMLVGSVQKWADADERRTRPVLTLASRKRA